MFSNYEHVKNGIQKYLNEDSSDFYERGIQKLVSRWQNVVDNYSDYFVD